MQHKHESTERDENKRRYFRAKIRPDSNQDAEDELKRELKYTTVMSFYLHVALTSYTAKNSLKKWKSWAR